MAQGSPKLLTGRAADAVTHFAASQSGVDLRAVTKMPPFAPQFIQLFNLTGAAITSGITLVPEDNGGSPSMTGVSIPANGTLEIYVPIKTLTTPANVTTIAYWWEGAAPVLQPHPSVRNP